MASLVILLDATIFLIHPWQAAPGVFGIFFWASLSSPMGPDHSPRARPLSPHPWKALASLVFLPAIAILLLHS